MRIPRIACKMFAVVLPSLALFCAGCGDGNTGNSTGSAGGHHGHDHGHDHSHDHNGHHHGDEDAPQTIAEAIDKLGTMRDEIRDAFHEDDPDKAHGPLHDVGHVLEKLESLIDESELSDADKAEAKEATNTMFDLYMSVDDTFHGKEGSKFEDVADKIDEAMTVLESKTQVAEVETEDQGE